MRVAPYTDDVIDPITKQLVINIRETINSKDDDYLLPIIGTTGTGKSRLALHLYEIFDSDDCSVDYIGLDQKDFATAIKNAKDKDHPRFCCYDEANVNRSAHMTKWNQDLEDLYLAIRGLQIFHVWNNPTAQKFPRTFIEERVKGLIYIFSKDVGKPRLFYFFTKAALLQMYDDSKKLLSHQNIKKFAKKYALYRGWFKDYKGKLMEPYNNKKLARMDVKVDSFFDKYASEDLLSQVQAAKQIGVSDKTVANWFDKLGGIMVPDEDYVLTGAGHKRFTQSGVEKLRDYGQNKDTYIRHSDTESPYIYTRGEGEAEATK